MEKMSIRIISIFCMVALMFGVFSGCGSTADEQGAATSTAVESTLTAAPEASTVEEKLPEATITMEVSTIPATVKADQSDNPIVKAVEEKLNVKLRFKTTHSSANDGVEIMRLNLATGQSGDIVCIPIWGNGASTLIQNGVEEGLFANMGDIAEKNPGRYSTLEKCFTDSTFKYYNSQYYKQPKENYAFWAAGYQSQPAGAPVYNMNIMNELGATIPKTVDEFVSYLRLVKEKKPDITPFFFRNDMGSQMSWGKGEINQIFFQTQGTEMAKMVQDSSGNWYNSTTDSRNKEIWKQLASYYKEGLFDKELFTVKDDAFMSDKFVTGKLAVATCFLPNSSFTSLLSYYDMIAKANPDMKKEDLMNFMQIQPEPLTGPGGSGYGSETSFSTFYGSFIANTSKNKERAMDVLNYLISDEGMTLLWYGIKGVHYQDQDTDGNVTGFDKEKFIADNEVWGIGNGWNFNLCFATVGYPPYYIDRNNGWSAALANQPINNTYAGLPQEIVDYSVNTWKLWSEKAFKPKPVYQKALDEIAEVQDIKKKLEEIRLRYFTGFIFGSIDVDSNWDKFVQELKDAGIDQYVQTFSEKDKSAKAKYDNIVGSTN